MDSTQRAAEIERLKHKHAAALAAPRMMDGNISPTQINRMSDRQKAKWQALVSERFDVEAQIRQLSRTDEQITADEKEEQDRKNAGRIGQIDSLISSMQYFKGKNGKILPKYAREIQRLTEERATITN
jgi:hypothetical protein